MPFAYGVVFHSSHKCKRRQGDFKRFDLDKWKGIVAISCTGEVIRVTGWAMCQKLGGGC